MNLLTIKTMADNYTRFPSTSESEEVNSANVEYSGSTLPNSGGTAGADINEVLSALDDAITAASTDVLDADNVTVDNVTFGTDIPSATDLTDYLDQLAPITDANTAKYDSSEVDTFTEKAITGVDLASALTYAIILADIEQVPKIYRFYGSNASTQTLTVSATGTPTTDSYVDMIFDFSAFDAASTLSILGTTITYASELMTSPCVVRAYYDGAGWNVIVSPSFMLDGIIDYKAIDNLNTGVSLNTDVVASKVITDFITVAGAVDLGTIKTNSDASKVKTDLLTVTGAVGLDSLNSKVGGIEALADVTDAGNVAAAGAVMLTGDQVITGGKNFTGLLEVAAPVSSSSATTKEYVDARVAFQTSSVTLTQANILALNGTPITLIAAPGATSVIDIVSCVAFSDYTTAAFTSGSTLEVEYATNANNIYTFDKTLLSISSDVYMLGSKQPNVVAGLNEAVELTVASNFTGGNAASELTIIITYKEVDFA